MTPNTRTAFLAAATSAAVGLLLATAAPLPARAADFRLPASEYGKVSLATKQSLGDASDAVSSQQNVFEPMSLLREDDPLRRLTRAVGRLDLLIEEDGERFMSSCTATIVNDGAAVLTASHCIPGFEGTVVEASILLDYFDADSDTIRLRVSTEPLANDNGLDYALVPLIDPVPADILPVSIARLDVLPGERLTIVHHPAGFPKKLTQYGCRAAPSMTEETELRHRCDTLPGSSGAPIFNANREIVGTHHTGGMTADDPASFNGGTRIVTILAETELLLTPADETAPADTATATAAPAAAGADSGTRVDVGSELDSLIESQGGTGDSTQQTPGASVGHDVNEIIEGN